MDIVNTDLPPMQEKNIYETQDWVYMYDPQNVEKTPKRNSQAPIVYRPGYAKKQVIVKREKKRTPL